MAEKATKPIVELEIVQEPSNHDKVDTFYQFVAEDVSVGPVPDNEVFPLESLLQVSNSIITHSESKRTLIRYLNSLQHHESTVGVQLVRQFLCDNVREYEQAELMEIMILLKRISSDDCSVSIFFAYLQANSRFLEPLGQKFVPDVNFYEFETPRRKTQGAQNIFAEKCKDVIPYEISLKWLMQSASELQDFAFLLRCESIGINSLSYILGRILQGDCSELLSPFDNNDTDQFIAYSCAERRILAICMLYGASKVEESAKTEEDFKILYEFAEDASISQSVYILRLIVLILQATPRFITEPELFASFVCAAKRAGSCEHTPTVLVLACDTLRSSDFLASPATTRHFFELLQQNGMLNSKVVSSLCGVSGGDPEFLECARTLHFGEIEAALRQFEDLLSKIGPDRLFSVGFVDLLIEFCLQLSKRISIVYVLFAHELLNIDVAYFIITASVDERRQAAMAAQRVETAFSRVEPMMFSPFKANILQYIGTKRSLDFTDMAAALVFCTDYVLRGIMQALDPNSPAPQDSESLGQHVVRLWSCKFCGAHGIKLMRLLTRGIIAEKVYPIIANGNLFHHVSWLGIEGIEHIAFEIPVFILVLMVAKDPKYLPVALRVLESNRRAEVLWCCRSLSNILEKASPALTALAQHECETDNAGFEFYEALCRLSLNLRDILLEDRDVLIAEFIEATNQELEYKEVYIPGDNTAPITAIKTISILKSHAKTPLLIRTGDGRGFIVKSGDSVAQDCFVEGVLSIFQRFFEPVGARAVLYNIVPFSATSGFIALIPHANSLDEIGNRTEQFFTDFCRRSFTTQHLCNFTASFAFCAVSQYILEFKDRHNGNMMLTESGDIAHIDFGFLLETAPGNQFSIEKAPFKYPKAFAELMGDKYEAIFNRIFTNAMYSARYFASELKNIIELIIGVLPCCTKQETPNVVYQRMFCGLNGEEFCHKCAELIEDSKNSISSALYDRFEALENDINC